MTLKTNIHHDVKKQIFTGQMVSKDDRKNNSKSILCIYQLSGMAECMDITLWTMLE